MAIDLGYDEGGSDDVLLVSMQLSITEQARRLRRKWRRTLCDVDVKYFHSREFDNFSHGVFAGVTRADRMTLLGGLSLTSSQHISIGMTAKITKSLFEQKTTPQFRSKWGTAYTFSIQMLVVGACLFAKHLGMQPEFNILIEDGHKNSGQAIESLEATKKAGIGVEIPSRILTVGLGSKQDHPILQAADMLAYSEWQRISHGDMVIYNAMHSPTMRFQPEFLDFDDEMVDVVVKGANQWMVQRKTWGQRQSLRKTVSL